jgi:hypothetical protein
VQGPCHSYPARAPNIVILVTPQGDLIEVSSSSYCLSLLSSKAGSSLGEGAGGAPRGLPSVSIGELWLGIDQLDEVGPVSTSAVAM